MIERIKVDSSNILAIGYSEKDRELVIDFKGGTTYFYGGVDKGTYEELLNAESKGKYFHKNIKGNYEFNKKS